MKSVCCRKEFDRRSTIPAVVENSGRLFENDLVVAFRVGKDLPRVPVSYGDELPLNQPSVRLEDVPTGEMAVDSPLAELQRGVESSLANMKQETEETDKPEERKEEE